MQQSYCVDISDAVPVVLAAPREAAPEEADGSGSALHDVMNATAALVTYFADARYDRSLPDPPAYPPRHRNGY